MCPLCLVNLQKAAGDTMRFRDISHYLLEAQPTSSSRSRGGRSSGTAARSTNSLANASKRWMSAKFETEPERGADGAAGGQPDRVDVVVEGHALAELAADERLARDREGDLAGAGVAEAAGPQGDVVPAGDAVDVALVDDAAVRDGGS